MYIRNADNSVWPDLTVGYRHEWLARSWLLTEWLVVKSIVGFDNTCKIVLTGLRGTEFGQECGWDRLEAKKAACVALVQICWSSKSRPHLRCAVVIEENIRLLLGYYYLPLKNYPTAFWRTWSGFVTHLGCDLVWTPNFWVAIVLSVRQILWGSFVCFCQSMTLAFSRPRLLDWLIQAGLAEDVIFELCLNSEKK